MSSSKSFTFLDNSSRITFQVPKYGKHYITTDFHAVSQLVSTGSKLKTETLEQGVKYTQS